MKYAHDDEGHILSYSAGSNALHQARSRSKSLLQLLGDALVAEHGVDLVADAEAAEVDSSTSNWRLT